MTKQKTSVGTYKRIEMMEKEIVNRIKSRRQSLNLTQGDLASMVDMSVSAISLIENKERVLKLPVLLKIAIALKLNLSDLMKESDIVEHVEEHGHGISSEDRAVFLALNKAMGALSNPAMISMISIRGIKLFPVDIRDAFMLLHMKGDE